MFRDLDLKTKYKSERDNIFEDFYKPALSKAVLYRRAVGYFSPAVLLNTPTAMSCFVENDGKAQIIFGQLIQESDLSLITEGTAHNFVDIPDLPSLLEDYSGTLLEYRIRVLSYLFINQKLELKVALRPNGIFHQKIAILTDKSGDKISFSGSANETLHALDPEYNSEEIKIFRSWEPGQCAYANEDDQDFEDLWQGGDNGSTLVIDIPEALQEGLHIVARKFPNAPSMDEEENNVKLFLDKRSSANANKPRVPKYINGNKFNIREHQLEALRKWQLNDYNGILELATGAGKTITAIYAATQFMSQNEGFVLIVSVPYQDLADQWVQELKLFNINALKCYGSYSEWSPKTSDYLRRNRHAQKEQLALVVVHPTLKSDRFQEFVSELDKEKILFIGDECHHHGGKSFIDKLFPGVKYRVGLSATPFHYLDEENNQRLKDIYSDSVYKYTLEDAVRDEVLTPYEYRPVPVLLTHEESLTYLQLTEEIGRLMSYSSDLKSNSNSRLKTLLMARSRLIGTAENKLLALESILSAEKLGSHTLFYCSDGTMTSSDDDDLDDNEPRYERQRTEVNRILENYGVRASPFTSSESRSQRKEILRRFKEGDTDALIAIKCLDEGIDVPACRTAVLIASSRNPRQFIQRRGRILRRSENKDKALIYDFVVVLPELNVSTEHRSVDFLRNELHRVADFARNSLFPLNSIEPIKPWLIKYNLEHLVI